MNGIERIKLIGKLVQLNKTVPGASPVERIKGIGQIIAIVKQLGGTVNAGGAKAETVTPEESSGFEAIKSNKDFVKFFDENDCEIRYGDEPEIKHLESYLKSSGQTHFECENWVNEDGFRDGGNGIISTTTKVKEKQVWDFNGKDWGYYLESDEAYRRLGEAHEAVAAFAEGVRNGTLKVINATSEKPASPEGKVTSVEDFCRRIEKNPTAIQDPENQTRKLLFAYLEEKHPSGFKGTLSLKGVGGEDHAYTAVWIKTNGEWYRDVQMHPEMTGALSQLDQDGSLVLFDFLRFASNGSLNSLPKYTPEDGEVSEAVAEAWAKDRETLQSIIDGVHPDMKLPVLYDALAGINKRQKYNPEYPEMLERALDEWQSVVMDMTAKIVA